ncbi:hypothetical protein ACS127_17140 [Amphibacillus sp. Q70]|uniref:hypothetical protein n=1 Tax=Amphibacillus sp. Q70 TaxID=3453416 RepID=UPI003F853DD7
MTNKLLETTKWSTFVLEDMPNSLETTDKILHSIHFKKQLTPLSEIEIKFLNSANLVKPIY